MSIVIPLFPSVLYSTTIPEEYTETYDEMITSYDFVSNIHTKHTYISSEYRVLDNYPDLHQRLLTEFIFFKDEVMKWYDTDFQIVTSWLTKTEKEGTSIMHCHKNSFYSGVLYFKTIKDVAPIEFCNMSVDPGSYMINTPPLELQSSINASSWQINPVENQLVFFPSHLFHRINNHQSDEPRYSLAFNIIPTGVIGDSDSRVNIINIK
tara:strand:+ start:65 stop:688 length:624 start_codon:yes stop_codon:yes gene_type:complete